MERSAIVGKSVSVRLLVRSRALYLANQSVNTRRGEVVGDEVSRGANAGEVPNLGAMIKRIVMLLE